MNTKKTECASMPTLHPDAAGIDIGSTFHVVAIPQDRSGESTQTFQAFTGDINRMADWLIKSGITTVAMESTGVYWVPVYEILEERGLEVILANARDTKSVPGRKSDVNDAQWIQKLHVCGLLKGSFRPKKDITEIRSYLRWRERLTDYAAAHIQHMQKSLTQMNIQLHHVVSDITGVTGLKIIRAIIKGERDSTKLAKMRDGRCKSSVEKIKSALEGNYQRDHLFCLKQSVDLYDFYQQQIKECDIEIERALNLLTRTQSPPNEPLPKARHRTRQPNQINFDVREILYNLIGADLTQIHGMGPYLALRMISECGTDMTRWPSSKHFTSWLTLCPGSKISGGKVLSAYTRKSNNRIVAHLRLAATTVGRTSTALGAFYRRLSARVGKSKAVTATARKIAVLFYNAMRYGIDYQDPGADQYEKNYRKRVVKNLEKRATEFGFILQPADSVS